MPHELIYTSAPSGLRPGSTGYCTVAQTPGLPTDLAEQLEALSHFRHLKVGDDPNRNGNPLAFAHSILTMGYRVHPQVEKAFDLGVPQKRKRQLIIGTRLDVPDYFSGELQPAPRAVEWPTLGEAICDLPPVRAGGGDEEADYDMERRKAHIAKYGRRYLYETLEVHRAEKLTAHRARPHSERDLGDFARLREGEHCAEAMKRGENFDFPYDKETFKDRYTRQHRNEPCSTIVAHLSKDGLMFIHPTQNRSLTPREAARIQSFPDWFEFPIALTHQFRVIGNAVPPLVSEAVGIAVLN